MSVPKVRRLSSPQHVSDRLRRAITCSERNTSRHFGDTGNDVKSSRTTTRIQTSSRSRESDTCSSNRQPFCETKDADDEETTQLPQNVLKLVVTPYKKDKGHCSSQSANRENYDLNLFEIYIEVLKELKYEVKTLLGINAIVPCIETPILGLINDCFQGKDKPGESTSVPESRTDVLQYAKILTVECVEIIERVIHQQSEEVLDFKNENNSSTRKKIKTLLLKMMLGIEQELITSEKILETIDTDLNHPSFKFIYCLLKYVIEKIAAHPKVNNFGSDMSHPQTKVTSINKEGFVQSNSSIHSVSEQTAIPDQRVEGYSCRLDKLLNQWTDTGDSSCKNENSQQVVVDCFHCLTGRKDQEVLLETVSQFTEEIKKRLISCHQDENSTHSRKRGEANQTSIVEKTSNDTVCNTEMSYYSWMMAGPNHSHRDRSSRSWSQCSNCQTPDTNVSTSRKNCLCQLCTRNNSSDLPDPALSLAPRCNVRSLSQSFTNHNNYCSISPQITSHNNYCDKSVSISDANNSNRGMSTSFSSGNYHRNESPPTADSNEYHTNYRTMADGKSYQATPSLLPNGNSHRGMPLPVAIGNIWPADNGNNNLSTPQSLRDVRSYHTMSPPLVLPHFPKFQLPNTSPCKTIGTQGCSHVPRCINQDRSNHVQKLCNHGNPIIGKCGRCLVLCENSPKPPYYDRLSGFKEEGFYGHKYYNTIHPQLFDSFSVSPEYKNGKTKDKKFKKNKNKEGKSLSTDGEQKGSMSTKERRSASPFEGRRSLPSNNDNQEREQVNERKIEKRKPPKSDDKKQNNDDEKKGDKGKKDKPKRERSPDKDSTERTNRIAEIEKDDISPKEAYINNNNKGVIVGDNDEIKQVQESKTRQDDVKVKNASSRTNGKQNDDHCTCCKCKKNNGTEDDSRVYASPCQCSGLNNQDTNTGLSSRPIYQFFANPIPVACNCQNKSDANKTTSETQKSESRLQMDRNTSNVSRKKKDSQEAETQTAKKTKKSDTHLPETYNSEPSAGQITQARSKNDQEPCIEKSESCAVIFSRSDSKHKADSPHVETQTLKTASKSDSKCKCPQNIEDIFQDFDDKYSKCVQEIKLRIREGLIPRFNGSDESFTVTREITIIPSRSKSACKEDKSTKEQQLKFQASQDQFHIDDTFKSAKFHNQISQDLREDIEELKRLVKNTRIGHCPCCKCEGGLSPAAQKPNVPPGSSSNSRNSSKPMTGSRSLGESQRQIETESDQYITDMSPKQGDLNESKDGVYNTHVATGESKDAPQRPLKKRTHRKDAPLSLNTNKLKIADESPEKEYDGPSRYDSNHQQEETTYYTDEPQTKQMSRTLMRVSNISVSEGRLSVVISSVAAEGEESETDRKNTVSPNTTNNYHVESKKEPEKDPLVVVEGENTGIKRDVKEITVKNNGLKWEDKKGEGVSEASLRNESEVWQTRNAGQRNSKKAPAESYSKSIGYDPESTSEKKQRKVTLVYDDEVDQQRKMSLERQALNESREQLFSRHSNDNVSIEREKQYMKPSDEENKKSWHPFDGLFGMFGAKAEEAGTSKKDDIYENVQDKTEETESVHPALKDPCERSVEENTIDSDFSSCDVGNPCRCTYSSCSTIDECRELFDSLPCNFYSEESVTPSISEVMKATETELYVMIIESQPPVAPATNSHDEIISLLLSVNNNGKNFSENGNLEKHLKAITQGNVPHTSTPNRYLNKHKPINDGRGSLPCFPVELISLQPSYDSIKLGSDNESSNEFLETSYSNDRTHLIERICSPNPQRVYQQEMRESKSSPHSKQEDNDYPHPRRDQPVKKKWPCQKPQGDIAVPSLEPRLTVEEIEIIKKTENKEVQVMKWNAKVQTAGPRKFNRTDITREVEDKLAVYLGLER